MSHPIHYLVDLYKELSQRPQMELAVYFCSDFGVKPGFDKTFGKTVKWYDAEILKNLPHKFLKNFSPIKTVGGVFSLINPGIIAELKNKNYDAIIIHGYNYFTNIIAIFAANFLKIPILFRGESHLLNPRSPRLKRIKKLFLPFLFKKMAAFLAIGTLNVDYYKHYGVPSQKIFLAPYAANNENFETKRKILPDKKTLKKSYGSTPDSIIILYLAKLIERKRPLDLLKAYEITKAKLKNGDKLGLFLIGDGLEKTALEYYVKNNHLDGIRFFGFKKPEELLEFYALADIFVLPSSFETWGMAINEAMNFALPIITTDMVGAAYDLVKNGENGFVYKSGDIKKLAEHIQKLVENNALRKKMGVNSSAFIKNWNYGESTKKILTVLDILKKEKIIVANPGSHHLWRTALAFQDIGLLKNYATGFYYLPRKFPYNLLKFFPVLTRKLKKRGYGKLRENKVKSFWFHDMIYLLSERFLKSNNISKKLIDARNKSFSIKTGKLALSEKASLLWSALDGSREAFLLAKKPGIICVLDQFIGHPAALNKILQEEIKLFPELKIVTKDIVPQNKLKRLENEMKLADFIVVGSEFAKKTLVENCVPSQKIVVIPYGADNMFYKLEPAKRNNNEVLNILFVGNISVRKGSHYLLRAMRELDHAKFKLKMVGQMEDKYFLEKFGNYFEWIPKVDYKEIFKFYRWAHVYVYPSLFEGSSLSIYEAMASGLPVITTVNSGSVVQDGKSGFIVPIRNIAILKEKILLLYNNKALREKTSESARNQAKNYTWKIYNQRVIQFIKILNNERRGTRSARILYEDGVFIRLSAFSRD